nr:hypothetical protein [Cellulosimicrobium sp. CUA-896]
MVEPPVWVPSASAHCRSATAAPEPLDDPPGVRDGSCGLRVGPPTLVAANSVVVVLPSTSAPAARSVSTHAASTPGTLSR